MIIRRGHSENTEPITRGYPAFPGFRFHRNFELLSCLGGLWRKPMSFTSRALCQTCHRVRPSPTNCTDCAPNESNTTPEHLGSCKRYKNRKSRNLSPPMQMACSPCYTHNGISDADTTRHTHKLSCTNSGNIGGCATNLSLANKWHLVWT